MCTVCFTFIGTKNQKTKEYVAKVEEFLLMGTFHVYCAYLNHVSVDTVTAKTG